LEVSTAVGTGVTGPQLAKTKTEMRMIRSSWESL